MDTKAKRNAREFAVASRVTGILSFVTAVILFILSRGLVTEVHLNILVVYFLLLESFLFALSGFILALIAHNRNGQGVSAKKTRNTAVIGLVFSILGIACVLILFNGLFGPKISIDYATLDHYLPP